MYFVLQCFRPLFSSKLSLGGMPREAAELSWMSGEPIHAPVSQPIEIPIDPDEPGDLLEMYNLEYLLMSDVLVSSLRSGGVDNLQTYEVLIRGPESGRAFTTHKAVNIVGTVACANMEKSRFSAGRGLEMIDVDFEGLVVDEELAGGRLMFRLAECVSAIVVHSSVREHLLSEGFDMLSFQDPSNFIG